VIVDCEERRGRLYCSVPYAYRDVFKAIPGALWDSKEKRWHWPASTHSIEVLGRTCKRLGVPLRLDDSAERIRAAAIDAYRARDAKQRDDLPDTPGRTSAWLHQRQAHHFAKHQTATALVMWMGTGKSRVAIGLLEEWEAQLVLIVCPTTVVGVWPDQITQHAVRDWLVSDGGHVGRRGVRRWGSVADRVARFESTMARSAFVDRPVACILNVESCWRDPFYKWARQQAWDVVICDESHRIKAPGGKQSMAMHQLGKHGQRRLGLTGTFMPHGPADVYAQFRFLDEGVFGTSYTAFKRRYFAEDIFGRLELIEDRREDFARRLALGSFQCEKDVLDLPPIIEDSTHPGTDRHVNLEPRSAAAYQAMWETFAADVGSGVVTAKNALSRILRLQQITSGYVGGVDDDDHVEQLGSEKRDALSDWLRDVGVDEPVVVFCRFHHDLDEVRAVAEQQGRRYGEVSGRSKDGLTDERRLASGIQVCGVQMQSGGVGIDLTAARFAVYYSIGHSLGDYLQSRDRVHRPGQTRTTTYVHLIARGTIDVGIRRALAEKRSIIDAVLAMAKEQHA
jgi:hypothetical protein